MPLRPRTETIRFLTLDELGRLLVASAKVVGFRAALAVCGWVAIEV